MSPFSSNSIKFGFIAAKVFKKLLSRKAAVALAFMQIDTECQNVFAIAV
jgi:hypothetical protein